MVLRALSQLILFLFLDLDLAHLPLAMSHLNTGVMRYGRCLHSMFKLMGIMWPILAMIFRLQALQEWLQGDVRNMLMAGTLRLLIMVAIHMIVILITVTNVSYALNDFCM